MYRSFVIFIFLVCMQAFSAYSIERYVPKNDAIPSYAPLIKKASPAVVNIYTKKKVAVRSYSSLFSQDPFFQRFFGDRLGAPMRQKIERSLGSGVILDKHGTIVTNYHVVEGSSEVTVVLADKREFSANITLLDEKTDLAILKLDLDGKTLPYLELMDSDSLEIGDIVFAIGNPFGIGQTVTSGIVSGLARTGLGLSGYQSFIQTDAAINPGNSGGALLTLDGKLAGINTAIYSRSGGSHGVGFATPANMVAAMLEGKVVDNRIVRPWLGVKGQTVTQDIAHSLGMKKPTGVLISALHADGAAKHAGLLVGDVVLAIAGDEVLDQHMLQFKLVLHSLGSKVPFRVLRNGKTITVNVVMEPPQETPKRDMRVLEGRHPFNGATIANLSPALIEELAIDHFESGVVVTDVKRSYLFGRYALKQYDIIRSINGERIETTQQLDDYLKKSRSSWNVVIRRGEKEITMRWQQ